MSYLTLPRLYFSGLFQTTPSTINNVKRNYDPSVYSNIENMEDVELVWNPMGNNGFTLQDCVVTRVDYADGSSATTAAADPIIGQPVSAVKSAGFPVAATLVDLDVEQQGVSEIWAMVLEIGSDSMGVRGDFAPAAFNSMWMQATATNAPRSSASASATYQSTLKNVVNLGSAKQSKFLTQLQAASPGALSIQFVVNAHNNNPEIFSFNADTLQSLTQKGVPASVVQQLQPLTKLMMQRGFSNKGDLPTEQFVLFALKQRLSVDDYNANIDTILATTRQPYQGTTPHPFTFGSIFGAVGTTTADSPTFFVASRMMGPQPNVTSVWSAPFQVSDNGLNVTLNLGNSLSTTLPGQGFDEVTLGDLWLVAFANGIDASTATYLTQINYTDPGFIATNAGIVTYTSTMDLSKTPLGVVSIPSQGSQSDAVILLSEDPDGWYLRADKFVFRLNPGVPTTAQNPFGDTATLNIHVLKFGQHAPDGTEVQLTDAGSGDPASALTVTPTSLIAGTTAGVATFTLSATDPGNPRGYLNGQLYFKAYNLTTTENTTGYQPVPGDMVSIQIYDQEAEGDAISILAEYGRMYLVMSFLAQEKALAGIDLRNMIKLLLEKPMSEVVHMPVTRDLSFANLQRIVSWVDSLNNS